MGIKKGTPGKGGQGSVDSFRYTGVQPGLKGHWTGYLAGQVYWALAHEYRKGGPPTQPCLDWLTDGQLRCPRCGPKAKRVWIGWVPVYREDDGSACVVIVHENAMDLLAGLHYPNRIMVGRCEEHASVFVRRADPKPAFKTENDQRKAARDVTPDLRTMWAMPAFECWLWNSERSDNAVSLKSDGAPFGEMTQAAAQRYSAPTDGASESDELFRATAERVKNRVKALEPSANGKHTKPSG